MNTVMSVYTSISTSRLSTTRPVSCIRRLTPRTGTSDPHHRTQSRNHLASSSSYPWSITPGRVLAGSGSTEPLRVVEGDIVTVHWKCLNDQGEVLDSSEASDEATTFEVGAGDVVGNQLFEAFDQAVRGLAVGETIGIKAEGGEWQQELLFKVPRNHPEIERLEGRYKNQGGVHKGLLAELSNGALALVVECDDDAVTLDTNNMMAGKSLLFEIELVALEKQTLG